MIEHAVISSLNSIADDPYCDLLKIFVFGKHFFEQ